MVRAMVRVIRAAVTWLVRMALEKGFQEFVGFVGVHTSNRGPWEKRCFRQYLGYRG